MWDLSVRRSVPASVVSSLTAGRLFRHEWRYPPLKFMNSITPERVDFTSRQRANLRRYTWNFIISGAAETCEFLPGTSLARLYFSQRCGEEMSLRERWEQWRAAQRRCSDSTWNKDEGWRNESRLFLHLAKMTKKRQRNPACFIQLTLKWFWRVYFLPVGFILGKNFFKAKYWPFNFVSHLLLTSYSFYQAGCLGHLLLVFINCDPTCDLSHLSEFALRDK